MSVIQRWRLNRRLDRLDSEAARQYEEALAEWREELQRWRDSDYGRSIPAPIIKFNSVLTEEQAAQLRLTLVEEYAKYNRNRGMRPQ